MNEEETTIPAGYCGECGAWCEQDTLCDYAWCPTRYWDEDEDEDEA